MAEVVVTEFQLNIDGFEANLKKATSSMGAFDKEVDDTQANTRDLEGTLGSAGQKLKVLSKEAGGAGKGVKDFGKTVQGGGGVVRTFTGELNSAFPVFGRIATAARAMGVAITTALGPVGLVIAAVVAAFAALAKIFFGTQEGADALQRVLKPLGAVFDRLLGLAQELTKDLFDIFSNPVESAQRLAGVIKTVVIEAIRSLTVVAQSAGELLAGVLSGDQVTINLALAKLAAEGAKQFDRLGKAADAVSDRFLKVGNEIRTAFEVGERIAAIDIQLRQLALERAQNEERVNRELQEQVSIAQDVTKSAAQRQEAGEKFKKLQRELTNFEQRRIDLLLEQGTLQASLNDTLDEEKIRLAQLASDKDRLLAEEEAGGRRVTNTLNGLRKQEADRAIAERERLLKAQEKADADELKAAIARVAALDKQELELSQRRAALLKSELETLKAAQAEELAIRVAGGENRLPILEEQAQQRQELEKQIQEVEIQALAAKFDAEYAAAEKAGTDLIELAKVQEEERAALTSEYAQEDSELRKARFEEELDQQKEKAKALEKLRQQDLAAEQNLQAAKNNALQAGSDLLVGELQKNEETAKLALAIQKGQAIAQVAISTAAAIQAALAQAVIAAGPVAGPLLAAPTIVKLKAGAALSIATILAQAISGAYEGERNIGAGGERPVFAGPKDRYLRRVHKGEDIISAKRTAKYRDILDMVHDDTLGKWMANMQPQTDGRYLPMMSMMAEGGAEKWMTTVTKVNNYGTPSSASKGAAFNDRRIVGALVGVGSSKEQRRQTQLLESMNAGMSRRQNKRYRA